MFAIAVAAGVAYGAGVVGFLGFYGAIVLATVIVVPGYARWDRQHHND